MMDHEYATNNNDNDDVVSSPGGAGDAVATVVAAVPKRNNGAKQLGSSILKFHDNADYGQVLGDALKYALSRDTTLLHKAEQDFVKLAFDIENATKKLKELEEHELVGLEQRHAELLLQKETIITATHKVKVQTDDAEDKIHMITSKNQEIEANIDTMKLKHGDLSAELDELREMEKRHTAALDDYKKMVAMYKEQISNVSDIFKEKNKNSSCEWSECLGDGVSGGPKYTDNVTPCCKRRICRACVRINHDPEGPMERCLFCKELINVYFLSSNQYVMV